MPSWFAWITFYFPEWNGMQILQKKILCCSNSVLATNYHRFFYLLLNAAPFVELFFIFYEYFAFVIQEPILWGHNRLIRTFSLYRNNPGRLKSPWWYTCGISKISEIGSDSFGSRARNTNSTTKYKKICMHKASTLFQNHTSWKLIWFVWV